MCAVSVAVSKHVSRYGPQSGFSYYNLTTPPLLPLHLYVATLKQQMHMEYVSLSWCDIQELAISIMVSFVEDCG
jgi:hypothetical protein